MLRFVVEKKSQLSSLPSFQKSGVSNSAFTASFLQKTSLIFLTFRTSSIYTHCRYARASSSFSLSAVVRANDVQEEEEHSSSLSFFLSFFTHTRACINSSQ